MAAETGGWGRRAVRQNQGVRAPSSLCVYGGCGGGRKRGGREAGERQVPREIPLGLVTYPARPESIKWVRWCLWKFDGNLVPNCPTLAAWPRVRDQAPRAPSPVPGWGGVGVGDGGSPLRKLWQLRHLRGRGLRTKFTERGAGW